MSLKRTIHTNSIFALPRNFLRYSTNRAAAPPPVALTTSEVKDDSTHTNPTEEGSALSRRFESLAEDALLSSPSRATTLASEDANAAAISDDLKRALADRIAAAEFTSQNAQAISIANLPSSASKHTRDLASARPWTGTESQEDAVLRMLVDANKPMKTKATPQTVVDLRPHNTFGPKPDRASRVAGARDRSLEYSISKDANLTADDKAQVRAMFRDRFQPGARPIATVSALMSLADQRIEDARARGQFNDIPRGKPRVEDHNAQSPFLDTTEYFLNKIIQKQEVLPPWVEKQQELLKEVNQFRTRIRQDWRRFVARGIATRGGTLEEQCQRAEEYAAAEARRVRLDKAAKRLQNGEDVPPEELVDDGACPREMFRDAEWEKVELKYNTLAIDNLNELCSSYNMMAPSVARKPMFVLSRELDRCFADVAPQVAGEIRERARQPLGPGTLRITSKARGSTLVEKLGVGEHHTAVVRDSDKPNYGFKDFWKDLFGRRKEASG
ncbi:hypothetical protein BDD12DRAFT_729484 [Trichophaea hybrida]|nr:hypothetical protein BDD12DRAFT_729484 [Trichophaea hybrida]